MMCGGTGVSSAEASMVATVAGAIIASHAWQLAIALAAQCPLGGASGGDNSAAAVGSRLSSTEVPP
eukprot:scaffold48713_cov28-Tisochrysis_lutea.AAC.2